MTQKFIIFKIAKNMGTTIHSILKMNELNCSGYLCFENHKLAKSVDAIFNRIWKSKYFQKNQP